MRRMLLLVPLALALAACGGGGTLSLDPVAAAASRTSKQGSERFILTIESGLPSGRYAAVSMRGVANNADGSGRVVVRVSEGGKSLPFEIITDGSIMYVKGESFSSRLPTGKSWVKLDLEKAAKETGIDFGSLDDAQQGSPSRALDALREAGKTVKVGKETVAGVATTKYRTTVDLEKAKLADPVGVKHLPVDVWIDGKGLVRKLSYEVSPPDPNKAGKFTFVLTGFGPTVTVEPPPADETVDLFDLMKG
jgi:predicted small lipoprotein YifL